MIKSKSDKLPYPIGRDPHITVPDARAALFRKKFSDRDQVTAEAGKYYALYHLNPSWKVLSTSLYRAGETKAAALAKPHVQTVTGMLLHVYVSVADPGRDVLASEDLPLPFQSLNYSNVSGKYINSSS